MVDEKTMLMENLEKRWKTVLLIVFCFVDFSSGVLCDG